MYNFVKGEKAVVGDIHRDIANLEKKYDISFPEILKKYYYEHNGEKIKLCVFLVDGFECEVSKIIPVKAKGLTFEKIVDNDRADGFIDKNFLPLASNRGGDYYYWDSKTEKVFLIFSDDIENPHKISNSLMEFFSIIEDCNK